MEKLMKQPMHCEWQATGNGKKPFECHWMGESGAAPGSAMKKQAGQRAN